MSSGILLFVVTKNEKLNHNMPIKQSVCIPILPQDAMPQEELLAEIAAIGHKEPS